MTGLREDTRAAEPAAIEPLEGSLRLQAMLMGLALTVLTIRSAEWGALMSPGETPVPWGKLFVTEVAIWLGWSLWAGLVIPLVRRLVERPPSRTITTLSLIGLVLTPVLVVPFLAAPVLRFTFGHQGGGFLDAWRHMARHNALTNLMLGVTVIGVAYSYLSLRRARRLEVAAERLNARLADAQLESLRAQLDPHFLFNALNSIAVLARRGSNPQVEQMVNALAGLLRHSLESSRAQVVTLGVELGALEHYLRIEQVRHGERLSVHVDVPEELHPWLVPSFLLQPLVENAIRHGYTDPTRPFSLLVRAEASGAGLRLTVLDDGAGMGSGQQREGVGLGNTRARLAGLYGTRATLEIGPGTDGRGARVLITLPDAPNASGTP
ncbi:MAG: histidine kinase [Gemmatimonadota bacterium]